MSTPLLIVLGSVVELLHVAPEHSVQENIRQRIDQAADGLVRRQFDMRMLKVGRY